MFTIHSGTFQGQWLRGVRHGYGVRQSVSYDVALRYPTHTATTAISIPVPGSIPVEKEDDILLRERDFRIEESRGGFVLRARTVPAEHDSMSGKHRMILDRHGRPSIRKTIVKVWFTEYMKYDVFRHCNVILCDCFYDEQEIHF